MTSPEIKYCPKCNLQFECNAENITQCQCYHIVLTPAQHEYIAANYSDCLCNNCLVAIQTELFSDTPPLS